MCRLSVIIPTFNRLEPLKRTLHALGMQTAPASAFEVIVVSDGSTDGTTAFLQSEHFPFRLRILTQPNRGPAAARNSGVKAASSELLLFLDDDVVPDDNLIREHLQSHNGGEDKRIVMGPMLTPDGFALSPWGAWEQSMLERYYRQMASGALKPSAREFFTGNASLNRWLFEKAGGFDETLQRAEDVEFAYRADALGAQFCFHPEARGFHYVDRSYETWLLNPYQYGVNDVDFTDKRGVKWLLPAKLREYKTRHLLTRIIIPICLGRKRTSKILICVLKFIGMKAYGRWGKLSAAAFSAIQNMQYYQGMADRLGGRTRFFDRLAHPQPQ